MTPRHGLSSTLRLLSRLPHSASPHRKPISSTTTPLKTPNQTPSAIPQTPNHDHRTPRHAAQPNLPTHIRHLMRSTPHPLTIITSRPHALHPPSALLVSSFNTITLTPTPYVSFNIKLPSRTHAALTTSHEFTASGVKDAVVAEAFVKKWGGDAVLGDGEDERGRDGWRGRVGRDGRLEGGKGGTWWMRCRVVGGKCVEVGDHVVVVAEVVECGGYEGGEGMGLVYADGGYRKVGGVEHVRGEKENT